MLKWGVNLKTLMRDTRLHVGFTLFLVWGLAIWHHHADANLVRIISYPLLSIATIGILDLLLTWLRYRKFLGPQSASWRTRTASFAYLPTAAIVSGFLIGLILAPTEPVYAILTAATLAALSKQFIAAGVRQHIFNPAAFGIMGVSLIFGPTVAWWGVAWGWYPILIFVPLMTRILWKLKRLLLPVGFLLVYLIYLFSTSSFDSALRTLVDPTVLFFAMVMLPEPITSPTGGYFKYGFGALVAIAAIIFSDFGKLPEIFLPALLFSNLVTFCLIKIQELRFIKIQAPAAHK